jgi:hypothetical protein
MKKPGEDSQVTIRHIVILAINNMTGYDISMLGQISSR